MPIKKLVLKKKKSSSPKKMENLTPLEVYDISKNKVNTLYYSLFIYIIVSLFVTGIIKYLKKLKKCDCFLEKNALNNANLKYLIFIEYVILILNIISVLSCIYLLITSNQNGGMDIYRMRIFIMLYLTFYISIFGYFIYSFYKLQQNIDKSCACASSSMIYLLYLQVFLMVIGIYSALVNLIKVLSI